MPTYSQSAGPAAANPDNVSLQSSGGVLAQKSEALVGAVVTSDFTTTSASLVDVTGMTITLAATNNVATKLTAYIIFSSSVSSQAVFSLNSSATKEYVWMVANNAVWALAGRNADTAAIGVTTNGFLILHGQLTGTTSGVVTKIQASEAGGNTLTVKVGSVVYGEF